MCLGAMLLISQRLPIAEAGTDVPPGVYKVLEPITHGNLAIYPVVTAKMHDTNGFLTLDEGIRSGEVMVTEVGKMHGMVRRPQNLRNFQGAGAEVNRLVLVNNSKRPLILLAGEVVTGGKQDRIVGKDRIVPAESDPVDLGVFCVEPGRWVESSSKFDTHANVMVQPSVRKKALVDADQQKVWAEVRNSQANITAGVVAAAPPPMGGASPTDHYAFALRDLNSTTSYAKVQENAAVQKQVQDIAEPLQKSFESVIKQLRDQNAVGVVVSVKGRIIWADIFASNSLLSKYWPKLLQSYATEALTVTAEHGDASLKSAQSFMDEWQSRHEVTESEPGLYRQTEMRGDTFRAFELTSLLPKQNFDIHVSKMAE